MSQLDLLTETGARLSDDGRYRHLLWRTWDEDRPQLGWIMLNPSTADAHVDDPTIRRCIGFARRGRYGGIRVANLFDLRATHPVDLINDPDPVGPIRDPWPHLDGCGNVVVAWGAVHKHLRWRIAEVVDAGAGRAVWCLGTTQSGDPCHPLYLRSDTPMEPWHTAVRP